MNLMLPLEPQAPVPTAFDYSAMPGDIAVRQQGRAAKIAGIYRQTVEAAGEIGRELLAAQAELEHGQFLSWVEGALGFSKSSAYRFMDVARSFGDKLPTVGSLPMTVVHKLAEKSTPEPLRAAVLKRIEAGEAVQPEAILEEVREARAEVRQRSAAEREAARRAALAPEKRAEEDALTARGQKGKEARERKAERERKENYERGLQEKAHAAIGASFLIDQLGADNAAAFFARFRPMELSQVLKQAQNLAHARRARDVAPVDMPLAQFEEHGRFGYAWLSPEEQADAEDLAKRFKSGDPIEPVVVVVGRSEGYKLYEIVEGLDRFRALKHVLQYKTIPTRIAPPVDQQAVDAIGSVDG